MRTLVERATDWAKLITAGVVVLGALYTAFGGIHRVAMVEQFQREFQAREQEYEHRLRQLEISDASMVATLAEIQRTLARIERQLQRSQGTP